MLFVLISCCMNLMSVVLVFMKWWYSMLVIISVFVLMNGLCGLLCLFLSWISELNVVLDGLWLICFYSLLFSSWNVSVYVNSFEMFWIEKCLCVLLIV